MNDSDDEVRERAYFYYQMLSNKKDKSDAKEFFNFGEEINIEELERYVTENREELTKEDSAEFSIDLSKMVLTQSKPQSKIKVEKQSVDKQAT